MPFGKATATAVAAVVEVGAGGGGGGGGEVAAAVEVVVVVAGTTLHPQIIDSSWPSPRQNEPSSTKSLWPFILKHGTAAPRCPPGHRHLVARRRHSGSIIRVVVHFKNLLARIRIYIYTCTH